MPLGGPVPAGRVSRVARGQLTRPSSGWSQSGCGAPPAVSRAEAASSRPDGPALGGGPVGAEVGGPSWQPERFAPGAGSGWLPAAAAVAELGVGGPNPEPATTPCVSAAGTDAASAERVGGAGERCTTTEHVWRRRRRGRGRRRGQHRLRAMWCANIAWLAAGCGCARPPGPSSDLAVGAVMREGLAGRLSRFLIGARSRGSGGEPLGGEGQLRWTSARRRGVSPEAAVAGRERRQAPHGSRLQGGSPGGCGSVTGVPPGPATPPDESARVSRGSQGGPLLALAERSPPVSWAARVG